jgi:Zn-finger nucleic acid-binding protein
MTEVDKAGVAIDTCPKCRGVWLDRGELEKLGERLARDDDRSPREFVASREAAKPVSYRDDERSERPRQYDDRRRYDDDDDKRYGQKKSGMKRFMDFFD